MKGLVNYRLNITFALLLQYRHSTKLSEHVQQLFVTFRQYQAIIGHTEEIVIKRLYSHFVIKFDFFQFVEVVIPFFTT